MLCPPVVDALFRDPQLRSRLCHRLTGLDQVDDLPTELDRVPRRRDDLLINA